MTRASVRGSITLGATVLAIGGLAAPVFAQPALQPDDRGGPGYTTGTTMGRDGAPSGASSDGARGPMMGQRQDVNRDVRKHDEQSATAGTPGMHRRGTETTEGGAGTTGGSGPGPAPTGR
jgi:hypothetical protein